MFFRGLQVDQGRIDPIAINPRHGRERGNRIAGNGRDVFTKSANHAHGVFQDRGNRVVHGAIIFVVSGCVWSACCALSSFAATDGTSSCIPPLSCRSVGVVAPGAASVAANIFGRGTEQNGFPATAQCSKDRYEGGCTSHPQPALRANGCDGPGPLLSSSGCSAR